MRSFQSLKRRKKKSTRHNLAININAIAFIQAEMVSYMIGFESEKKNLVEVI
jgi:hypothetical protein